jgi:hypothetical protein
MKIRGAPVSDILFGTGALCLDALAKRALFYFRRISPG